MPTNKQESNSQKEVTPDANATQNMPQTAQYAGSQVAPQAPAAIQTANTDSANTALSPSENASAQPSNAKKLSEFKPKKLNVGKDKKKKRGRIIIILLIVLAVVAFLIFSFLNAASTLVAGFAERDFTTLEFTSFQSVISGSGTTDSDNIYDVYSPVANGGNVEAIFVEVGDTVHEGMNLMQLNTESLQESLDLKIASYNTQKQINDLNIKSAQDAYDRAKLALDSGTNTSINTSKNNLDSARASYDSAVADYNAKQNEINTSAVLAQHNALVESTKQELALEQAKVDALKPAAQIVIDRLNAIINDTSGAYSDADKATAKSELENPIDVANVDLLIYKQAEQAKLPYESAYSNAVIARDSAYKTSNAELESLGNVVTSTQTALSNAELSYTSTVTNANTELENLYKTLQTTKLNADQTAAYNEIEQLKQDIANSTIKAEKAGVVTSISAVKDTSPMGILMTIKDEHSLIVETKVDEFDVNSIYVNMPVEITSNSTGDTVFNASVISVAPSPASSASTGQSASEKAEYDVKIKITSDIGELKLGMNTRISFITEERDGVITVPFDCLFEDENGVQNVLIYTENEDGSFTTTPQPVEAGSESDFEQIISGENIVPGTVVVNNASDFYYGIDASTGGGMVMVGGPGGGPM